MAELSPLIKPLARLGGGLLALLLPALAAGAEGGEEAVTPARRVAEATQGLAQSLGGQIGEIGEAFSALEAEALGPQLLELALQLTDLALVILTAVGLLLLLRPAVRPLFGRIERWARDFERRMERLDERDVERIERRAERMGERIERQVERALRHAERARDRAWDRHDDRHGDRHHDRFDDRDARREASRGVDEIREEIRDLERELRRLQRELERIDDDGR